MKEAGIILKIISPFVRSQHCIYKFQKKILAIIDGRIFVDQ